MSNLFEKKLEDYLTFYKTPIGPNDLDPALFVYDSSSHTFQLHTNVLAQIDKDLQSFSGEQPSRIKKAYIVGKALRPGNNDRHSSLKVIIVLNKDIMDMDVDGILAEDLLTLAKHLSNRLAIGTTHPIVYSLSVRDIDASNYNGVYDLQNARWYKIPSGVKHGKGSLS